MANLFLRKSQFVISIRVALLGLVVISSGNVSADEKPIAVNVSNFVRAESDRYFADAAGDDAFGKL